MLISSNFNILECNPNLILNNYGLRISTIWTMSSIYLSFRRNLPIIVCNYVIASRQIVYSKLNDIYFVNFHVIDNYINLNRKFL